MKRPMEVFLALLRWSIAGSSTLLICACYGCGVGTGKTFAPKRRKIHVQDPQATPLRSLRLETRAGDTVDAWSYTDDQGESELVQPSEDSLTYDLVVQDMDGSENGGDFQTQKITLDFSVATDLVVTMVPKTAATETATEATAPTTRTAEPETSTALPSTHPADAPAPR